MSDETLLFARLCLASVFLVSGIHKACYFADARQEFRAAQVPCPDFFLVLVIALHIIASLGLILGFYFQLSAYSLAVFMVLVTFWVRDFWNKPPEQRLGTSRDFLANTAILGGLLFAAIAGPGDYVLIDGS